MAALLWSGYEGWMLGVSSKPLRTPAAPRRIVSLQLAPTTAAANAIVRDWNCTASTRTPCADVTDTARYALARDTRFIAAYVTAWTLLTVWAATVTGIRVWIAVLVVVLIAGGGLFDLAENWLLGLPLGNAQALPFRYVATWVPHLIDYVTPPDVEKLLPYHRAFTFARLAAMNKFALLLVACTATVALAGGAVRLLLVRRRYETARKQYAAGPKTAAPSTIPSINTIADLIERETEGIFRNAVNRSRDYPQYEVHAAADEQFVTFRAADLIGLTLSGGGIRSATFNLGLLQGLHRLRLLRVFDYLSTVSGGGYVGSFWSAWLASQTAKPNTAAFDKTLFPEQNTVEAPQVRHLREFSGFLAPRWGFFEVEAWTAIVAVLAGLVPALLVGLSVIGCAVIVWLALTFPLASKSDAGAALVAALVTTVVLAFFERMWQVFKRESAGHPSRPDGAASVPASTGLKRHIAFAAAAVLAVWWLQLRLPDFYTSRLYTWPIYDYLTAGAWQPAPADSGIVRWWTITGIADHGKAWRFSPRLFDYGVVWLTCSVGLIMLRLTYALWPWAWKRDTLAAFDRVLMRILGLGVVWCGIALLWHVTINLAGLKAVATGAILSAGAFAALRNWIGVALRPPAEASIIARLKPYLPQVLAYVTIALTVVLVGGLLVLRAGVDWFAWWQSTAVMLALLVLALFIKPDQFGLHAFYRERISRAYAGACNALGGVAADNRGTDPQDGDERRLSDLKERPLHLVCCTANDLSGDQVETLGRGGRSAALSKYGFWLGRYARAWTFHSSNDRLGAAVTASAAAFNSNMGHISARVGPGVSFLMTMLNLRLGLWVRHPAAAAAGPRRWPGLLYYREMLALTSSSGHIAPNAMPGRSLRDVHLSDGGHFENLGLYELVRRHCRYIIVSDCGADPSVAFDDLGNALRRIREDFGVDIQLDVSPLRPGADGCSRQHVAVGTITYSPMDRGILLYIKPSITGDEPTDVQQYGARNRAFPHESTGDQFYDEAQWESYRRLGLHASDTIFKFVERGDRERARSADWLFAEASHQWGPAPVGLADRVLEMTTRFGALESELQQRQSRGMLSEVFPEMAYIPATIKKAPAAATPAAKPAGDPATPAAATPAEADTAMATDLAFLLRVTQLMEDVWLTCELDRWSTHPLNLGWINLFARWATSDSFRFWWPLFAPMFSPGFRSFIQERFPMRADAALTADVAEPQRGTVTVVADPDEAPGLAAIWWKERSTQPARWKPAPPPPFTRVFYQNELRLRHKLGDVPMQVGLAAVTRRGKNVGWTSDDFFVPPSLWGAGIGWYFLVGLLTEISQTSKLCHVVVKMPPVGLRHEVARGDRRTFVNQYRKIGFREERPNDRREDSPLDKELCTQLGYDATEDTLLILDLEQWKQRAQ